MSRAEQRARTATATLEVHEFLPSPREFGALRKTERGDTSATEAQRLHGGGNTSTSSMPMSRPCPIRPSISCSRFRMAFGLQLRRTSVRSSLSDAAISGRGSGKSLLPPPCLRRMRRVAPMVESSQQHGGTSPLRLWMATCLGMDGVIQRPTTWLAERFTSEGSMCSFLEAMPDTGTTSSSQRQ